MVNPMKSFKQAFVATGLLILLVACGGGGGGSTTVSQQVGQFIDDPVGGLTYSCTNAGGTQVNTGTTDTDGRFNYLPGQTCTFKVGNVTLGTLSSIPVDGKVTPQDVAGVSRAATSAPSALAIAQFLQSLNDGTSSGKIVIPVATTTTLSKVTAVTLVSSTGSVSQADLQTVVAAVGKTLVSPTAAQGALDKQISSGVIDTTSGTVSASAPVVLNSILVTSEKPSNAAGYTQQMTATGHYSDGSTKNLTSSVTWKSSDTSLLTVDSTGLAKGLKKGSASVSASYTPVGSSNAISGSFFQTTTDPTLLSIVVKNTANPPAGLTDQLTATGSYSDGTTTDLTKSVTWSTSDSKTVTVDANGLAKGLVKGSATVTASFTASTGLTPVIGSMTETVVEATPLNIVISYVVSGITAIQNLASTSLQAILKYSDDTTSNVSSLVNWIVTSVSGGGNAVVTVDKSANTATLIGTSAGVISTAANYLGLNSSSSLNLTVSSLPVSGVAASGWAINSGTVSAVCVSGSVPSTTTDSAGKFTLDMSQATLPCILRSTVPNTTAYIYSIVEYGATNANITPLTHLLSDLLFATNSADVYNGFKSDFSSKVSSYNIKSAKDQVVSVLKSVGIDLGTNDLLKDSFQPKTSAIEGDEVNSKINQFLVSLVMADANVTSLASAVIARESGVTVSEASSKKFGSAIRYDSDCPYARDGNFWVVSYDGSAFEKFNVDSSSGTGIVATASDGTIFKGKKLKDTSGVNLPCVYQFANSTSSKILTTFFTNSGAFTWHLKKVSSTSSNTTYEQYTFGLGLPVQTKNSIDLNDFVGEFSAIGFDYYQKLGTMGSYVLNYVRNSDGTSKIAPCTISNSQPICGELVNNSITCSDLVDGVVNCKNPENSSSSKTIVALLHQQPFFVNIINGTDSKGSYVGTGFFSKSTTISLPKVQSKNASYWYSILSAGKVSSTLNSPATFTSVSEAKSSSVLDNGIVTYYNVPQKGQFWSAGSGNTSNVLTMPTKFGIFIRTLGAATATKFSEFGGFLLGSVPAIAYTGSNSPTWFGSDINAPVYSTTTNSSNQ